MYTKKKVIHTVRVVLSLSSIGRFLLHVLFANDDDSIIRIDLVRAFVLSFSFLSIVELLK